MLSNYRNARFHIETIRLRLLITYKGHHIFGRLGQANVAEKVLFNTLPEITCTSKYLYSELVICYGYVRAVMPPALYH